MIVLDTHVVVWLYRDGAAGVPPVVAARLNDDDIGIAPIVRLELAYLAEIGRLTVNPDAVLGHLASRIGLSVIDTGLDELVDAAVPLDWTRDPFDRLIVAHSAVVGADLATRDEVIRHHVDRAFWD